MRIIDASLDVENPDEPLIIDYHQDAVVSLSATVRIASSLPLLKSLLTLIGLDRTSTSAPQARAARLSSTKPETSKWTAS